MNETCKTCAHFVQHYVRTKHRYSSAEIGHCIYPMIKPRCRSTPACQHYREKEQEGGGEEGG